MDAPRPANSGRLLLCVAAPAEARAVLAGLGADTRLAEHEWTRHDAAPMVDLVVTGVGKACAAGAAARVLDPARHRAVLSIGICGALPRGRAAMRTLGVVAASACVFADEGVQSDDSFQDMGTLGFPIAPGLGVTAPVDGSVLARLRTLADETGPIATVSTCSGTDALAAEVARRTGAIAEAMEGAAVGLVAHRLGVAFGELRVVSNATGSRTRQAWDLPGALARLSDLCPRLPAALALRAGTSGEG